MSAGTLRDIRGQGGKCPLRDKRDTPFRGGVPMSPTMVGAEVKELARRVGRLSPDWGNPERYFEERDILERALRRAARQLEAGAHG
jgi:hypothetical protein